MIRTLRKRIPWRWAGAMALPAGAAMFVEQCSDTALAFTMRKFTSDPTWIVFLGTINVAFNFLVAPYAAWKSDRAWTRWGRRVPFLIAGWSVMALALAATPFASNLWLLAACILAYQFGMDWGYTGPWNPLYFEVVPSPQRGRAIVISRLAMIAARLGFNLVLLGQFDEVCCMHIQMAQAAVRVFSLRGEHLIYLTAAFMALACVVGIALGVRETPPAANPPGGGQSSQAFVRGSFWRDVFGSRQWRPVYRLAFLAVAMTLTLGSLEPLLVTEQFGYAKFVLGRIQTTAILSQVLLVLPAMLFVADRLSRVTLLRIGLVACAVHPLAYWCFVRFFAAGGVPTPSQIVVFSVLGHVGRMAACLSIEPLMFDAAPPSCMGAVNAGFLFVRGLLTLIMANGVGFWVKAHSHLLHLNGSYDYMSGYLYVCLMGALGCVVAFRWSLPLSSRTTGALGSQAGTSNPCCFSRS